MSTEQNGEMFKGHTFKSKYFNLICSLEITQLVETPLHCKERPTQLNKEHLLLGSKRYYSVFFFFLMLCPLR